jgi:hypothetical protein
MKKRLSCATLSLALYQEVAAQLRQLPGVVAVELEPQGAIPFDYAQSQIAALQITWGSDRTSSSDRQLRTILDYYAQSFGLWHEAECA